MKHVLVNTQAVLTMTFSAGNSEDDVTVKITDANGVDQTPVDDVALAIEDEVGGYSFTLAPQSELTQLTVDWTGKWGGKSQSLSDEVEVVGGVLFSVEQLRRFGDRALASAKFTDQVIIDARTAVTDFFEHECKTSFIPRYSRDVIVRHHHNGHGRSRHALWLSKKRIQRIISATVNGSALDAGQLDDIVIEDTGRLHRTSGWVSSTPIVVEYVYGHVQPPPKVVDAAMTLARYELVNNDISDRTVMLTNELGTIRLSTPGANYPTGLPVVDAILARYDESAPMEPR